MDCQYCGRYELPLDVKTLDPSLARKLNKKGLDLGTPEEEILQARQRAFARFTRGQGNKVKEKYSVSKKRRPSTRTAAPAKEDVLYVSEYEITSEPIEDKRYRKLPREVKEEFERLHALIQTDARKAIEELPGWIKRYPDLPILYNYLSVAYSQTGAYRQAERTILENLQRNPDYLFARLNYAEICLARRDYEGVAEILENKFDLKLLCPHRRRFHLSEFVGFMSVVGRYFVGIGEPDAAKKVYKVLRQVAPNDLATRQLRHELHPGLLQRITRRLLKAAKQPSAPPKL